MRIADQAASPPSEPSPVWHQEVLAQRRTEIAQVRALPWNEVKRYRLSLAENKPHRHPE